jgi:hypothetical protein
MQRSWSVLSWPLLLAAVTGVMRAGEYADLGQVVGRDVMPARDPRSSGAVQMGAVPPVTPAARSMK